MNVLDVNNIIYFPESEKSERILWIDPNHTNCFTIDMNIARLLINFRNLENLENCIENNEIKFVFDDQNIKIIEPSKIKEIHKTKMLQAYEIVGFLDNRDNEPEIYNERFRGKIINEAFIKFNVKSKSTIYSYLREYW